MSPAVVTFPVVFAAAWIMSARATASTVCSTAASSECPTADVPPYPRDVTVKLLPDRDVQRIVSSVAVPRSTVTTNGSDDPVGHDADGVVFTVNVVTELLIDPLS